MHTLVALGLLAQFLVVRQLLHDAAHVGCTHSSHDPPVSEQDQRIDPSVKCNLAKGEQRQLLNVAAQTSVSEMLALLVDRKHQLLRSAGHLPVRMLSADS
ncbi:hypothetical protein IPG36_06925 [bacterium]|nr:MAG: hypothetical protein IPG36_06925 [bacterium]